MMRFDIRVVLVGVMAVGCTFGQTLPQDDGIGFIEEVSPETIHDAVDHFVTQPNAVAAGEDPSLAQADAKLSERVEASLKVRAASLLFLKVLDTHRSEYAYVLSEVRGKGLPDVFAAVPLLESRYSAEATSRVCAKGWWQLMPETAVQQGLAVSDCQIVDADGNEVAWSPQKEAPGPMAERPYVAGSEGSYTCAIKACAKDERTDLHKSTAAALALLETTYTAPEVSKSGAALQLALLSFNSGKARVMRAYKGHLKATNAQRSPTFYGDNILCEMSDDATECKAKGGMLMARTQHYAYPIIAQHLLAVCYYGQHYADEFPVFESYAAFESGYCAQLSIPSVEEVRKKGSRKGRR